MSVRSRSPGNSAGIIDVARAARVSPATVSRVLNSPDLVSEKTIERVKAAIADLGYVPNFLAGGLATSRRKGLAFLLPTTGMTMFNDTVVTLTNEVAREGLQVQLVLIGNGEDDYDNALVQALSWRPAGVVSIGPIGSVSRTRLEKAGIPIVQTWDVPHDPIDMAVGFSNEAIGAETGRLLIQKGYRRPYIVSSGGSQGLSRRYGLSRVVVEAGLDEPEFTVIRFPSTYRDGRGAIAAHLDAGGRPDVVVCSSDWAAHGVMVEARARGLRVPEDLALVGLGDMDFAVDLDLTTVRIDGVDIGRRAARFLLDRLQGKDVAERSIDVGFEVVVRGSI